MTNNSIFTRVLALVLCFIMVAGMMTSCFQEAESNQGVSTETPSGSVTTPSGTTKPDTDTTTTTGDSANNDPVEDPVDPNEIYSGSTTLSMDDLIYGTLANNVFIGDENGVAAMIPADVKVEAGASALALSVTKVEEESLGDTLSNLDVHVSGIALDNTVPMTVMLGAILPIGLANTELKLYHVENGTPVLMMRVDSAADFAIHNQYVYDAETGNVTIYVASFSVFTAVQTTVSKWDGETVVDKSWYNEEKSEFTIENVGQFLGFRDLVDAGTTFAGKTVTLATDIDLNDKLFNPIGGGWAYNGGNTFNGTFDGGNHTIYNLRVNGWELDETGDKHSGTSKGAGLFSSLHNATIKNLAVVGSELIVETTSIGIIAGCAQGQCTFENIVVSDATLGNYQMRNGGIVGDIYVIASDNVQREHSHIFKNIVVDSSVKLSSMWGDFDTGNGGVIGGKYGSAKVLMQNVIVAAELDVFSDVTAAYQWYAYRRCGMLIGYTGQNSPKQATNASADFLKCENVSVYYGDWTNYTYYQFNNQTDAEGTRLWNSNYPWVRAEESPYNGPFSNVRYGNPIINGEKINTLELATAKCDTSVTITFNQLYGGGQGVYGTNEHDGVSVNYSLTKTIYINNNLGWENLKLYYWFANGDDTWTTLVDPVILTEENGVYKIELPAYAFAFKIVADDENVTRDFYLSEVTEPETYNLNFEHVHYFYSNKCDCGTVKQLIEHEFTLGEDGEAKHSDGSGASEYTETVDDYTLTLSDILSVYKNARDAMGNSCIKLGTSSAVGEYRFTVPNDIEKVIIYVAGYKANNATVKVNDVQYEITTHSNDGEYTAITVDTSETKTVSFTTIEVKGESRCMINTISFATVEFINNHTCVFSEATCETKATCTICGAITGEFAEHNWNDATCAVPKTCSVCGETDGETLSHTDNNPANHICDICNAENVSEHNYADGYCSICGEKEPADYSGEYYIAAIRSSGNYWYMTSDLGTANTKRYQAVDSGLTTLPTSITDPVDGYVFVLVNNDDGTYSIYAKEIDGNNYLGWTSGNSGALVSKEDAKAFTIEFNDKDKTYTIKFGARYLSLNNTSGNNYFAFYEGTQVQELALIPINNCEHNYNPVITDPSCTVDGYTTYTCTKCGYSYTGDTVSATGHQNTTTTTVDATCTTAGSTTVTCDDCDAVISTETIPTIPHTDVTTDTDHNCDVCGAENVTKHVYTDGICDCGATEPVEPTPDPETPVETTTKYTFSNYTAGTQYAENETHELDDNVTIITTDCHFTTELRIYSSSTNNGYAIITSKNPIKSIGVNAGNKVDTIVIYGSNDKGATWTEVATISVTSTSYKDYSATLNGSYMWLKLDVKGSNQVRIKSITLTTVQSGNEGGETECTHSKTTTTTVNATCITAGSTTVTCDDCGETVSKTNVEALGHTTQNGTCERCGEIIGGSTPTEPTVVATFSFGANGSATHKDGTAEKTTYSETTGSYTLSITEGSKFYPLSYDAKGNSCIKLGSNSAAGKFTFTVPENVTKVIIYVAGYKANTAKVSVNSGDTQTISTLSNNGEYTAIEIDTSTTKTVTLTTVSGGYRAMVNTIEFWGTTN